MQVFPLCILKLCNFVFLEISFTFFCHNSRCSVGRADKEGKEKDFFIGKIQWLLTWSKRARVSILYWGQSPWLFCSKVHVNSSFPWRPLSPFLSHTLSSALFLCPSNLNREGYDARSWNFSYAVNIKLS